MKHLCPAKRWQHQYSCDAVLIQMMHNPSHSRSRRSQHSCSTSGKAAVWVHGVTNKCKTHFRQRDIKIRRRIKRKKEKAFKWIFSGEVQSVFKHPLKTEGSDANQIKFSNSIGEHTGEEVWIEIPATVGLVIMSKKNIECLSHQNKRCCFMTLWRSTGSWKLFLLLNRHHLTCLHLSCRNWTN